MLGLKEGKRSVLWETRRKRRFREGERGEWRAEVTEEEEARAADAGDAVMEITRLRDSGRLLGAAAARESSCGSCVVVGFVYCGLYGRAGEFLPLVCGLSGGRCS